MHSTASAAAAAAAAKSLQSCLTLCNPIDSSPPGSLVPGILQARTLERVAISFSNAWKWKVKVKLLSRVRLLATPWTAAQQAPLLTGFSRQEYWSGVSLPSPSLLPNLYHLLGTCCVPNTATCLWDPYVGSQRVRWQLRHWLGFWTLSCIFWTVETKGIINKACFLLHFPPFNFFLSCFAAVDFELFASLIAFIRW